MTSHAVMHDPFRPKKLGTKDRSVFITQDSEVGLRAITAGGDIHLMARCEIAQTPSTLKWQLRRILYDKERQVRAILWPLNSLGIPSRDYKFNWVDGVFSQITGIDLTNPCVIHAENSLNEGDQIFLSDVQGTRQLNFTGDNVFTVTNPTPSQFELKGIDASAMDPYKTNGTVSFFQALQYTFA